MDEADETTRSPEADPSTADTASLVGRALDDLVDAARATGRLLRAELRLARSSVTAIIWFAFATLVLAFGAWLGLNALIVAGVHAWSGSVLLGACLVFLANLGGAIWTVSVMRRCVRDLTLPRTRSLFDRSTTSTRSAPTARKAHA